MRIVIAFLLATGCSSSYGQLNRSATVGDCNATAIGKNITVTVSCATGLSHADAEKFARQFEEILSKVSKTDNNSALILRKLSLISRSPTSINNTASTQFGIANAGGTVIDSPVTTIFGVEKPPPTVTFSAAVKRVSIDDPQTNLKQNRGLKPDPPSIVPMIEVTADLEGEFVQPAFRVHCSQPCAIDGTYTIPFQSLDLYPYPSTEANSDAVVLRNTPALQKGTKVVMSVFAKKAGDFQLLSAEAFIAR